MKGYEERVFEYMNRHGMIRSGDQVVLGLSGGADSVALFFVLLKYRELVDFELTAVHVNHCIRGEAADNDQHFVEELCEANGMPLRVVKVDVPREAGKTGESLEEAGRRVRYEAFRNVYKGHGTHKIAVAHHASDQAETFLFNVARGSGIKGMRGMLPVSGDVIRPLLAVDRAENEAYLRAMGQIFVTDVTNLMNDHTRSLIRNSLMPVLNSVNSRAVSHICVAAEEAAMLEELLIREVDMAWMTCVEEDGDILISEHSLTGYPEIVKRSLTHRAIIRACGHAKDIGRVHVNEVLSLFSLQTGRFIELPYGLKACRTGSGIRLSGKKKPAHELPDRFECEYLEWNGDSASIPKKDYTKYFDYDRIVNSVSFRNPREGDYLEVDGEHHKKKLARYLMDEKVDRHLRSGIPLVCDGDHVMWVVGHRISYAYRVTEETKRVLKITYKIKDKLQKGDING